MGKKFLLLTLVTVMAMVFGVRAWGSSTQNVSADTFNDKVDPDHRQQDGGGPINAGDAITTVVKTGLGSNLGSFYTSILTQIKGISATGTVPVGDTIGTGSFNIRLTGTLPCNSSSGNLGPSYAIYSAKLNATSVGLSEAGYAVLDATLTFPGDGSGPSAYDTTKWVADYDDDNYNNRA